MLKLCSWMFAALLTALLAACGGGGDDLPQNVTQLRIAFVKMQSDLCIHSNSFIQADPKCLALNPDLSIVMEEQETGSYNRWNLTVRYKGVLLMQEQHWAGYTVRHGFLSTGEYLLQIEIQSKVGIHPHFFVNGKEIDESLFLAWTSELRVREFGNGWLMLESVGMPPPYSFIEPRCFWTMYNVQTQQIREYGRGECSSMS